MAPRTHEALRTAAERLAAAGLDHVELRRQAGAVLRRHVDFDVAVWATVDPVTVMCTHCLLDGMPRDEDLEAGVFRNEYGDEDVLKLADLAAQPVPAGTLVASTGGDPSRSPRWERLYRPRGIDDELRVVIGEDGSAWGALHLLRGGRPFRRAEVERAMEATRPLARGLREALLRAAAARPDDLDAPPGLVGVDPSGRVRWMSDEARALLEGVDGGEVPAAVAAVVARRAAGEAARAAIATREGGLVAVHATSSRPPEGAGGTAMVIVERVRPYQLADLIVRARGLTRRERQVVELIARGRSTSQIARALVISEWTVQDHCKSIFAKFGVQSRPELVASVFFDHYAPRHEQGATPSPYGWFLGG